TDYKANGDASRIPASEIYAHLIVDLKTARDLLSVSYPTSGRVRPNKSSATALLARVYLTLGEWELARKEASAIIESGTYV
ncbi:MAG TPA: RagB/SusD family nutrient uptake outer membrane protein, partial [Candidatus Dojkabacteria bacterium]|nr:RagB/SusD family nutrient uptake outer membrane protein [Candidatus Dojkabacteria bacterium]